MSNEDDITERLNKLLEKQEKLKKRAIESKPKKPKLKKPVVRKTKPTKKSKSEIKKAKPTKKLKSKVKIVKETKSANKPKPEINTLSPNGASVSFGNDGKKKSEKNIKSRLMSLFRKSIPAEKIKPTAKEITKETKQKEIRRTITKETKPTEIKKVTVKEKGTLVRKDGASSTFSQSEKRFSKKMNETIEKQSVKEKETPKTTKKESIVPVKKKGAKKPENKLLETITVVEVMKKAEIMDIESPVVDVVRRFSEKKCEGIFISKKGKIIGLIILPDILEVLRRKKKIVKLKAGDIMGELVYMNKDGNLSKAILSMHMHKSNCVAVIDHKNVVGVVTRSRILSKLAKNIFVTEEEGVIGNIIETKVDKLLDLLRKKETNMKELEEKLNLDEEKIEEWLEILEDHDLIKYKKSLFGKILVEHVK